MIIREEYLKKIRPFYHSDLIKVITGMRRSGKSVLMHQIKNELIESGIEESKIIYINFENLEYAFIKKEIDLYEYIKEKLVEGEKYYLIFDEVQNVEGFEKAVNSFRATGDASIFITGSNGKLLSGELATHLSGRYVSFRVMPFSFSEMCQINGISSNEAKKEDLIDYMTYGGLPQRFSMKTEYETRVYLKDLYNSVVVRDILMRNNVKDIDLLNRIFEYMVMNTSQLFSAKSISKFFESENRKVSTETIYNYLEYITTSLLINKVVRYDIRGKKILTRLDKYYLTDLGLGRIKNTGFKVEIGSLIENLVYNELLFRGYDVYVGKTPDGEIDFIVREGDNTAYYQVAYLLADEKVVSREFGAFKSVKDNYPKYLISMDDFDFSRDGIIHISLIDFLLEGYCK